MKQAYPIVLTPAEHGYSVYVPDLDINTDGDSLANAIDMASDAIGLWGITAQDVGHDIPAPSSALPTCKAGQTAAYALVDFDAYRQTHCTLPTVISVAPQSDFCLLVRFATGMSKVYDVSRLFPVYPAFLPLRDVLGLFTQVHVDPGGHGISWNDDIDLDAAELWANSAPI